MSDSETGVPSLALQPQLISQIASGIAAHTREPWTKIEYTTRSLFPYAQELAHISKQDGGVVAAYPPNDTSQLASQLREVMYRPQAGTWFTFTLTISRDGSVDATFDYDNEPAWSRPTESVFYVQDLERFPRNDAHIPEWLARELELGRAQDAEYDETEGPRKRITPITEER